MISSPHFIVPFKTVRNTFYYRIPSGKRKCLFCTSYSNWLTGTTWFALLKSEKKEAGLRGLILLYLLLLSSSFAFSTVSYQLNFWHFCLLLSVILSGKLMEIDVPLSCPRRVNLLILTSTNTCKYALWIHLIKVSSQRRREQSDFTWSHTFILFSWLTKLKLKWHQS